MHIRSLVISRTSMLLNRIIRMHDNHTCEISVLSCKNSPLWSKTASMQFLPKNLDYTPSQARPTGSANHDVFDSPCSHGEAKSQRPGSRKEIPHDSAGFELSLPSNARALHREACLATSPARTSHPVGRWALVRIRKSSLDSLPGRGETGQRQLCVFPQSDSPRGPGKFPRLESIHPGASCRNQNEDCRSRLRQLPWRQTSGSAKSMDSPTVPLPSDLPAAGTKRALETPNLGDRCSRIDLSVDSYSSGASRRTATEQGVAAFENYSKIRSNCASGNDRSRIFEKSSVLSGLSDTSSAWSSYNHKYSRIDGAKNSGSHAPLGKPAHARIASPLGYSVHSDET